MTTGIEFKFFINYISKHIIQFTKSIISNSAQFSYSAIILARITVENFSQSPDLIMDLWSKILIEQQP